MYRHKVNNVADDLGVLLANKALADVVFHVGGKVFHAHKNILSARSPVFAAMFEHNMKEKKDNRVDITDIEGNIFEELLKFIYTDEISASMHQFAKELLSAGDKVIFNG